MVLIRAKGSMKCPHIEQWASLCYGKKLSHAGSLIPRWHTRSPAIVRNGLLQCNILAQGIVTLSKEKV